MMPGLRFKIVSLDGNYMLQYEDNDGVWHGLPVVDLTDDERDELLERKRIKTEHVVPPAPEPEVPAGTA